MSGRRFQAGLEKLVPAAAPPEASVQGAALAGALELDEGSHRMAEAREIVLEQIHPNPHQPRQTFDPGALDELAASIREQGVLQPITVTPADGGYQIVAGERRWRAARLAGLERIPALVRSLSERDRRVVAMMENLQREDLDDIDRARGLADLKAALGTQVPSASSHDLDEEVGRRLGISGRAVRNFVALLTLPESIQRSIASGSLTEKHGRAIRRVPQPDLQSRVAETAARLRLTGDETVALVRSLRDDLGADLDQLAWRAKAGRLETARPAAEGASAAGPSEPAGLYETALARVEEQIRRLEAHSGPPGSFSDEALDRTEALGRRLLILAEQRRPSA